MEGKKNDLGLLRRGLLLLSFGLLVCLSFVLSFFSLISNPYYYIFYFNTYILYIIYSSVKVGFDINPYHINKPPTPRAQTVQPARVKQRTGRARVRAPSPRARMGRGRALQGSARARALHAHTEQGKARAGKSREARGDDRGGCSIFCFDCGKIGHRELQNPKLGM